MLKENYRKKRNLCCRTTVVVIFPMLFWCYFGQKNAAGKPFLSQTNFLKPLADLERWVQWISSRNSKQGRKLEKR